MLLFMTNNDDDIYILLSYQDQAIMHYFIDIGKTYSTMPQFLKLKCTIAFFEDHSDKRGFAFTLKQNKI